ncbi:polysaccharide biosynthesis tyrosine autokinase [Burkholderia sp. BE12]|uniref:polysaccharide biosynthesis tyrosine autokinase n=1 Tax=Burkholderia sp. BE12 TaxID=2082394 RepID=UPI000CF4C75A|nr:polysaccharide biosynthesis tyrosine autokinase [Burkholderia sp. BE12]
MNSMKAPSHFPRDSDEVDIRGIADMMIKNVGIIGIVACVFVLFGGFYALVAKPVYSVDIVVQVESNGADMMGGAAGSLVGGLSSLFDVKSTDDGEMEILRSRLVTEPVVVDQRLAIEAKPDHFPIIGAVIARFNKKLSTPGLFGMGGFVWGGERISVSTFEVPRDFLEDRFFVTFLGDGRFRLSGGDLDADATGRIGVPLHVGTPAGDVTLTVAAIEGRPGARFVVKAFSKQKMLTKLQKALTITEKGKDQSGVIGVTYENDDPVLGAGVLNEIADNYVRQNADRKAATAEKSLRFLTEQVPDVEKQLRAVEDRLNAYQTKHEVIDLTEQAKAMLNQAVTAQTSLFELEQKRKALASVYTPEHPQLASLDQQIAAAKANVGTFNEAIQRLPDAQQNIVRLRRDVTVQTEIYVGLLNSIQQLRLATASKIGNVRVIDHAIVPDQPVWPKPVLVVALAAVIGLVVGACVAIARAVLFGGVTDPSEIERDADLNVIATIPLSPVQRRLTRVGTGASQDATILALARPHEPAVEALRSLCTALQFLLLDRPKNNVVLVTGPAAGIGKSFISANVAALLGQSNKRVLLIDGDLRRGRLAKDFGTQSTPGLSSVLRGEAVLDQAIVRGVSPHVDFMPTGPRVGQPVELFASNDLAMVLSEVSHRYDIVLLDAPPLLPVTDATVFARYAGTILLAARSGMTTQGEILESVKRIERVGATVTGVVFNGFRPGLRSAQYGNYGAYAYEGAEAETRVERM